MKRRTSYNPKRRIVKSSDQTFLAKVMHSVRYGGNPEHKRNPGDFGLTPPSSLRLDKACCDEVSIVSKAVALSLLRRAKGDDQ